MRDVLRGDSCGRIGQFVPFVGPRFWNGDKFPADLDYFMQGSHHRKKNWHFQRTIPERFMFSWMSHNSKREWKMQMWKKPRLGRDIPSSWILYAVCTMQKFRLFSLLPLINFFWLNRFFYMVGRSWYYTRYLSSIPTVSPTSVSLWLSHHSVHNLPFIGGLIKKDEANRIQTKR